MTHMSIFQCLKTISSLRLRLSLIGSEISGKSINLPLLYLSNQNQFILHVQYSVHNNHRAVPAVHKQCMQIIQRFVCEYLRVQFACSVFIIICLYMTIVFTYLCNNFSVFLSINICMSVYLCFFLSVSNSSSVQFCLQICFCKIYS